MEDERSPPRRDLGRESHRALADSRRLLQLLKLSAQLDARMIAESRRRLEESRRLLLACSRGGASAGGLPDAASKRPDTSVALVTHG
jgi:hypothetical protein